ncbi:hypothetical protein SEA_PHAYONCE_63 [Mycobacterium phage Phayonce]|uniref:Uncharacterized protein n=1 Tax=Mycobacterium phage Phayonce TaxID=1647302 RepID=A0A0F6WDX9_9CAUD|nr:hypothetical protein SEA_PHAYONCE_63 [Mycobacterium phage Phayonce]AKF14423.1 hypothetical protein SEA_PHAYONCE_63 [Mycobacterium phage Phayonce]
MGNDTVPTLRVGHYVRLAARGRGGVYEIAEIAPHQGEPRYRLTATAKHPYAAKRVPDALRWYRRDELFPLTHSRTPR